MKVPDNRKKPNAKKSVFTWDLLTKLPYYKKWLVYITRTGDVPLASAELYKRVTLLRLQGI